MAKPNVQDACGTAVWM